MDMEFKDHLPLMDKEQPQSIRVTENMFLENLKN